MQEREASRPDTERLAQQRHTRDVDVSVDDRPRAPRLLGCPCGCLRGVGCITAAPLPDGRAWPDRAWVEYGTAWIVALKAAA
ncbi:hypothetical protein [Solicola gregarius]|uniref:Uncharacterized protein n=1 Tax=Solicola gregarius TaxID=2908642 RepID=A0AA46TF63_9ACTN|nr:hypothetical protein [Solicola gregarius]UYM03443.1 hypothetical protein L0C25_12840 [Solicola gregarius]